MRHSKINGLNSRSTTLRAAIVPTAFLLFVGIVFLVYLLHIDSSNSHTNTSELIKETPFENLHPEFENSYYIDVYNDNSTDQLKEKNTIFLSDANNPIYLEFAEVGSSTQVIMVLYYDYVPIKFSIDGKNYVESYTFDATDSMKVAIPVFLDEEQLNRDDALHKLFVTFTVSPNHHAAEYDRVTNFYGANAVYDLVYSLSSMEPVFESEKQHDYFIPDGNHMDSFSPLTLNTDYGAKELIENDGILRPEPLIEHKQGTPFKLMYFLDKSEASNTLLIITINFSQAKINGKNYYALSLDGNAGTAYGEIEIALPNEPGMYEIIGYAIQNPFSPITSDKVLVDSSYRFTLNLT